MDVQYRDDSQSFLLANSSRSIFLSAARTLQVLFLVQELHILPFHPLLHLVHSLVEGSISCRSKHVSSAPETLGVKVLMSHIVLLYSIHWSLCT